MHLHIVAKGVIVALFVLDALFSQPVNGFRVAHAHERSCWRDKVGVEFFNYFRCDGVGQGQIDDAADNLLEMCKEIVKGDEVEFRLDVRVL